MSLTGAELLTGFSKFLNDHWSGTTTSAGLSDGTTLVDTALGRFGDGRLVGYYLRPEDATNQYDIRRVTDFTASSGTCEVRPAFDAQTASGEDYGLHKYDPEKKFEALDEATFDVADELYQLVYNDTITSDGISRVYTVPSAISVGPQWAMPEEPVTADSFWNFLSDPRGDSTDNWTTSSVTASTVSRDDNDLLVPKYDETCTKLVVAASTAATYTQTVANMTNSASASDAADREMTFGAWVYCTEGSKIRVRILDDNGTVATSGFHGGEGWELLTVSGTIAGDNSTTLSAQFVIDSTANASTTYWNRGWFYYGDAERITNIYREDRALQLRRDDTTQTITLQSRVPRGYQIRLVGKDTLSLLGTTAATQVTNTMEVSAATAQLLYARAAEILFIKEGINTENVPQVIQRINIVRERFPRLRNSWAQEHEQKTMVGPWSR